ncbi:YtxH domain-containing protein [Facklamia lactis]|uniref:YtxH domain-containing protein n=1 Tax=Facklamia lactis TaxID=2749967 RepID=UPI0018CD5C0F|nr:YtxH domain-containing protein [Facklamia lactis]MBG9980157.1 YtxH domain-containing protein [Facklamia lactis]
MSNNNNDGFLLGAIIGATIGGIAALLYAPKSGEELRKDINDEVDYWLERANDYTEYAVERGVEMYDAASVASDDIRVSLKSSAENLKRQVSDFKDEASKEWGNVKEELRHSRETLAAKAEDISVSAENELQGTAEDIEMSANELVDKVKNDDPMEKTEVTFDEANTQAPVYEEPIAVYEEPVDNDHQF